MTLSQRERRILKEIEDDLTRADPRLSARLARVRRRRPRSPRAVPVALLAAALGIALMISGTVAAIEPAAWVGAAVTVGASLWLLVSGANLWHRRRTRHP